MCVFFCLEFFIGKAALSSFFFWKFKRFFLALKYSSGGSREVILLIKDVLKPFCVRELFYFIKNGSKSAVISIVSVIITEISNYS